MAHFKTATLSVSALALSGALAQADIVQNDDVIMTFSLCVGNDCVNGESFGFDTIRLKENNVRIKFQDTSNTASFPSTDWQITANDSTNGGANKFSIDDIDSGRTPFTIEASAPSNALYVDDGGRIGLGTNIPVSDIHVKSGNTPTLRLEQDGSSGFTPQTWDVAGNEANFFVRDATNGSRLVFRIQPGAPDASIYIANDGDIGMGTTSPDTAVNLDIERQGDVVIELENTSSTVNWQLKNQADLFRITTPPGGTDEIELELNGNGDLALTGTMSIGAGTNATATPAVNSLRAQLFVDSADGDLKVIFPNGTVQTLATN